MTDPVDRLLRAPDIEPLAPHVGHFDHISRRARSRRRHRAVASSVVTTLVLVGAVTAVAEIGRPEATYVPPLTSSPAPASASPSATTGSQPAVPNSSASVPAGPGTGPVAAHFKPWSVSYGSAQAGFLLGDAPCARPPCTSLAVTGDGGRSWRGLPAPQAALPVSRFGPSPSRSTVSEVRFANPRDGWVFGGALYATHDGGRHWEQIVLRSSTGPLTIQRLETDGRFAYAVAAACQAGEFCGKSLLYETAVGSMTWRPAPGDIGSLGSTFINGLSVNRDRGLATAGGTTWVRDVRGWTTYYAPHCDGLGSLAGAVSASDSRLVVLCGEGENGVAISQALGVRVSDDAGSSWQNVGDRVAPTPGGVLSLAAASRSVVLIGTAGRQGGAVLRSTDGGRTFADAGLPRRPAGWWFVGARSATSLVALPGQPDGSLWTSRDGGRTWQEFRFA